MKAEAEVQSHDILAFFVSTDHGRSDDFANKMLNLKAKGKEIQAVGGFGEGACSHSVVPPTMTDPRTGPQHPPTCGILSGMTLVRVY